MTASPWRKTMPGILPPLLPRAHASLFMAGKTCERGVVTVALVAIGGWLGTVAWAEEEAVYYPGVAIMTPREDAPSEAWGILKRPPASAEAADEVADRLHREAAHADNLPEITNAIGDPRRFLPISNYLLDGLLHRAPITHVVAPSLLVPLSTGPTSAPTD